MPPIAATWPGLKLAQLVCGASVSPALKISDWTWLAIASPPPGDSALEKVEPGERFALLVQRDEGIGLVRDKLKIIDAAGQIVEIAAQARRL